MNQGIETTYLTPPLEVVAGRGNRSSLPLYFPNLYQFTSGNLNVYVDGVNGDDTLGDGSSSDPFKTINKGLIEHSGYSTSGIKYLHLADADYTESDIMPSCMIGNLQILGNATTPANVKWKPTSTTSPLLTSANPQVNLLVDGVQFQDVTAGYGLMLERTKLTIGYCKWFNNFVGFYSDLYSNVFFDRSYTSSTFDGNNIDNGDAFINSRGSEVRNGQSLNISKVYNGILNNVRSTMNFLSSSTTTITQSSTLTTKLCGIINRSNSFLRIGGTLNLNGSVIDTVNAGIECQNSEVSIVNGATLNFSNFFNGWNIKGYNYIEDISATYAYTNCTTNVHADQASELPASGLNVSGGAGVDWFDSGVLYGFDARYVKL